MSTSSESTETGSIQQVESSDAMLVHDRVVELANGSADRSEFLKNLADELRSNFKVAIVAIQASHWPSPIMLVTDDLLSEQIQRDALRDLLGSANSMPIACEVPISGGNGDESARGLRIELTSVPERSSVLMVYANRQRPTAVEQIADLKQLSLYADSTRSVAPLIPVGGTSLMPNTSELAQPQVGDVLRNRNSLRLFHLDLNLNATAYRIANESRQLLQCDRTTVLVPKHGRFQVKAVSGVSVVDRRSNAIRSIERLTEAAMVMGRPLVLPTEEPLPPQIQEPLDDYLDESGVMSTVMLPLFANDDEDGEGIEAAQLDPFNGSGDVVGVIMMEYFSGNVPATIGPAMTLIATEATLALGNSLEHKQVFGLSLWKSVGRLLQSSRMPLVCGGLILCAALLAGSMIHQVEHYVVATGSVEPTERREVFAAVDGVVKQIRVEDGQVVQAGEVLLELENAELENRAETLAGEIQTASQRLAAIQSVRLSDSLENGQSGRMALEERQISSELTNLRAQQKIVRAQQADLIITSPINGTIVGWQLDRRLADRPVTRGNLLVSVADHNGPWSLRLTMPDNQAGPILKAAEQDPNLSIHFAVATQPEASFAASLASIGTASRLDEMGEHLIDARANVIGTSNDEEGLDAFTSSEMKIGADVTAKIHCGPRSVLRSWFSDVFDFVHRNVLFYF
ncbi:MAG: biotin/lipoyl-binding protein [Rubripirellula sp.]